MAGLWSPGVWWTGNTASPSEPTLSIPRAQKAQKLHPKARQGPGCHMGPPSELAETIWATEEQPEASPSPGPSDLGGPLDKCPHFPNRDAKPFSSQGNSLLKVTNSKKVNTAGIRSVITTGMVDSLCGPTLC